MASGGRYPDGIALTCLMYIPRRPLNRYAQDLSAIIYKRLILLHALASFVDTDIVNSNSFTTESKKRAESFLSGLRSSTKGIRNFAIAPGGNINFVSPLVGNEKAIGHELLSVPLPGVKDVSLRAIEIRDIAHSTPYELRQGGLGLVARKAIIIGTGNHRRSVTR
ncbi:hypothetical protein [Photobacterium frigidiphilum]|uniref:hypothetical protein n=1 Tax=Photobacterium frigidiphilum TaxID=264736 RepID=UPI0030012376